MASQFARVIRIRFAMGLLLFCCTASQQSKVIAQYETSPPAVQIEECKVDLTRAGDMKDIISNALILGLEQPEADVQAFLQAAESRFTTGQELLEAAAAKFDVSMTDLTEVVLTFKHVNCAHASAFEAEMELTKKDAGGKLDAVDDELTYNRSSNGVSKFAADVALHVIIHELGHALIREFDLPVLGNEETMADAFATCYLTTHLPDRALDVLIARTRSLMIEASEVPRKEWSVRGEHNNDARRAWQIAALAIAADPEKYISVAGCVGMTDEDIRRSRDYGAEIHRSWRRVLQPLRMPAESNSSEVRVDFDSRDELVRQLQASGLIKEIESIARQFDWHSQITLKFVQGDGGAAWSRSSRTITVHSEYVRRFIKQGETVIEGESIDP